MNIGESISCDAAAGTSSSCITRVVKTYQISVSRSRRSPHEKVAITGNFLIKVIELLPQVHMWPSAVLLSAYISSHSDDFLDKTVFDLGAGCGLTSLAASLAGCRHVISSERSDEEALVENLRAVIALNKEERLIPPDASIEVMPFSWGDDKDYQHPIFQQQQGEGVCKSLQNVDIVLGSDVFYSSEDFDPVLYVVYSLMLLNPFLTFITAYHQRSASRSIAPYLSKFNMKAEVIDSNEFLHAHHLQTIQEINHRSDLKESVCFENLEGITLIKISNVM